MSTDKISIVETDYAQQVNLISPSYAFDKLHRLESQLLPYIDRNLRKALLNRSELATDAHLTDVCVIFTDLRGFTNMTLRTDLQLLSNLLNNYYDIIIEHVYQQDGVVDKFMGDGAMCLFGAVEKDAAYINKAVTAAQMILRDFREMVGSSNKHLALGIGIAAGSAVVGTFGNGNYMSFTALGPTVNLASRIQGLATGRDILSNKKVAEVIGLNQCKLKGEYELKGITRKMPIYYLPS